MEDSGIVEEVETARRGSSVQGFERTGWESVVFLVEEIGHAEAPALSDPVKSSDQIR